MSEGKQHLSHETPSAMNNKHDRYLESLCSGDMSTPTAHNITSRCLHGPSMREHGLSPYSSHVRSIWNMAGLRDRNTGNTIINANTLIKMKWLLLKKSKLWFPPGVHFNSIVAMDLLWLQALSWSVRLSCPIKQSRYNESSGNRSFTPPLSPPRPLAGYDKVTIIHVVYHCVLSAYSLLDFIYLPFYRHSSHFCPPPFLLHLKPQDPGSQRPRSLTFPKHPPLIRAVTSTALISGLMTHQYAPFPLSGRYGLSSPFTKWHCVKHFVIKRCAIFCVSKKCSITIQRQFATSRNGPLSRYYAQSNVKTQDAPGRCISTR